MIALSWSGGKDCARALEQLRAESSPPDLLLTTVDQRSGRVTHHGVGEELLRAQAKAVGLPLVELAVPRDASPEAYGELIGERDYEAILVSVDPAALDASFLGRRFDRELLAELPAATDPCGENGEFHTFVSSCPDFTHRLAVTVGRPSMRAGFPSLDLELG